MLYQLAGFGTLHFVVPKPANWVINLAILGLIIASSAANRQGAFGAERKLVGLLILVMEICVFYGVLTDYTLRYPPKEGK
jgi:hypothetical protein